jgi:hypothetical protein
MAELSWKAVIHPVRQREWSNGRTSFERAMLDKSPTKIFRRNANSDN